MHHYINKRIQQIKLDYRWLTLLLVFSPAVSIWPSFIVYLLSERIVKLESLAREGSYSILLLSSIVWIFKKSRIPKSIRPLFVWMGIIVIFSFISVAKGSPIGGIGRDARDALAFAVSAAIGYYYCRYNTIRTSLIAIMLIAVPFVIIERLVTPVLLWKEIGFTDYLLASARLSAGFASSEGFQGYYSEATIDAVFMNYDKYLQGGEIIYRCGGILGGPILFGHFMSAITCFFFYDWRIKQRRSSIFIFFASLIVGLMLIRTKGYIVPVAIFMFLWSWRSQPRLRFMVISSIATCLFIYLKNAFQHNLTAAQHVITLYNYSVLFLSSPILGTGLGSGLYDDSYIGRLLVEGGIVLTFLFYTSMSQIFKQLRAHGGDFLQAFFVPAFSLPLLFTTAAMSFVSAYLYGLIIGTFLNSSDHSHLIHHQRIKHPSIGKGHESSHNRI